MKIGPFNYTFYENIDDLLAQDDHTLLTYLSTSPLVEPPHFIEQTKKTLRFIQKNPIPSLTVFKNGQAHLYKRNEDCSGWVPVI